MLELLLNLPALLKILGALALILALNAALKSLTAATLIAALALGVWLGHPLLPGADSPGVGRIALERLISPDNLMLGTIIVQVVCLSYMMAEWGVMEELVGAVKRRISRRAAMAALPAIIGWLPMPGGAYFSAPLVDRCDLGQQIPPLIKTKTNYWFRHIWEYWWPLYPGVMLALMLTGLPLWQWVLLMLPFSLAAVGVGYLYLLRRVPEEVGAAAGTDAEGGSLLALVGPILLTILLYALIQVATPRVYEVNRYLPMVIGLCGGILLLARQRRIGSGQTGRILLKSNTLKMVVIVFAVRVFGAMIDAKLPGGVDLGARMSEEIARWHIPALLIVMIVPFVCGLTTGIAIGMVGAGLPVVVLLAGKDPDPATLLSYTALGYSFGYIGIILSPVHICLLVSNEYFKVRLMHSLVRLLPPSLTMLALTVGYHFLIRFVFTP